MAPQAKSYHLKARSWRRDAFSRFATARLYGAPDERAQLGAPGGGECLFVEKSRGPRTLAGGSSRTCAGRGSSHAFNPRGVSGVGDAFFPWRQARRAAPRRSRDGRQLSEAESPSGTRRRGASRPSPVRGVGAEGGSSGAGTLSCRASGPGMRRAGCATAVAGFRPRGSGHSRPRAWCDGLLSGDGPVFRPPSPMLRAWRRR